MASTSPPIGFLVKTWPKLSETFILEEVLGLEQRRVPLHLFALNPPSDTPTHDALARVAAPVSYLPAPAFGALLRVLAGLVRTGPARLVAAGLRTAVRREAGRWRDFVRGAALARLLRAGGIGHLHAHFISDPAAVAEIAAALAGIPLSLSAHAKDIYLSPPPVLRRKLLRASFTVTCTDYNRRHLQAIAPAARVHRMYHGVDLDRFRRRPDVSPDAPPLLLAIGRYREKKGFPTLIEACRRLRDGGIAFACEIVGYGEEAPRLQAAIEAADLGAHVRLSGKLTRDEVIARYQRATLFVMPSQLGADGDRDGIPNVLLEAMAMELPVVTTPISGIPELVRDGTNGLLVAPGDAAACAAAIARLLAAPELRARLGQAGRIAVLAGFDNRRNLDILKNLLENHHDREPAKPCVTGAELAPGVDPHG